MVDLWDMFLIGSPIVVIVLVVIALMLRPNPVKKIGGAGEGDNLPPGTDHYNEFAAVLVQIALALFCLWVGGVFWTLFFTVLHF